MKKFLSIIITLVSISASADITNVTSKLTNPDFADRYAGWFNQAATKGAVGGFVHQTNSAFAGKHAEVYMEKWVAKGSKIPNCTMYQHLKGLTPGTYTLVCNAFCGNGSGGSYTASTGGYLFAQDQQTPISGDPGEHRVVFTVGDDGRATVGIKSQNAACNWMAFDNFRLYYNTEVNADSLAARQQIVDAERQSRQAIEEAARSAAKVTTYPYVASGVTIALIRATYTLNGTSARERGVCWSSESKEPTILDECTTEYFSNNGYLFRLEQLKSATGYWARPYVITTDGKVAYGESIRFFTERKGNITYHYNYYAQVENPDQIEWDYNINSGMAETVWMYNQLSYIPSIYLDVHYARGAGAGGGTAECSYGGWMNVSQNVAYQQTGTMLHETNHGVGVGTTGEWKNNANLRENVSSGKWLGPRATKMVRLLENNDAAFMQGDGTHMWSGTTSGTLTYGYGINGAHEDSYSPSNQLLYFGNILITHALHQDGLVAPGAGGFVAAYTFTHDDDQVYYLKAESDKYGFNDRFMGYKMTINIITHKPQYKFGNNQVAFADIADDPYYQWKLTFDPTKAMYAFKNVGSGQYLYNSNAVTKMQNSTPTTENYFMLLPARSDTNVGDFHSTSYWMVRGNAYDSYGVKLLLSTSEVGSVGGSVFDPNNESGEAQRLYILTSAQASAAQTAARDMKMARLNEVIAGCESLLTVPVHETAGARSDLETTLADVKEAKSSYTSAGEVKTAIASLLSAATDFLTACRPSDEEHPADVSFMWQNASLASSTDHWTASVKPASGSGVWEYFQKTFDLYQTSESEVPAGHYRLVARAFQRPGSYQNVYTDYITNHTDNVNATLYTNVGGNVRSARMANLWRDCTATSLGTGSVSVGGKYVPNDMSSANAWFSKGYYVDSLYSSTKARGSMRIGLKGTTGTSYWVCFKGGIQVLFYGDIDEHGVDAVEDLQSSAAAQRKGTADGKFLDKNGRIVIRKNGRLFNASGEMLR